MQVGEKIIQNLVSVDITVTAAEVLDKMLSERVENAVVLNGSRLMGLMTDSQLGYRIAASKRDPTKVAIYEFVAEEKP
jgi:signal-transduction protein with cAMP-binding, CBS, and nucleotidyltransferase domain